MKDTILTVVAILGIFVAFPVLILWLRDRLFHRPMTKEQMAEYSRRVRERLTNPDFSALEKHFGCSLPNPLKKLYGDSEELDRGDFYVVPPDVPNATDGAYVGFYNPADAESLKYTFHDGDAYFAFADDGCGNAYIINPREADPPVLFHNHETVEIEPVAPSLSEFMKWDRREPQK